MPDFLFAAFAIPFAALLVAEGWCALLESHPWLDWLYQLLNRAPSWLGNPLGLCGACTTLVVAAGIAAIVLPYAGPELAFMVWLASLSAFGLHSLLESDI